jgi:hypothetical protein
MESARHASLLRCDLQPAKKQNFQNNSSMRSEIVRTAGETFADGSIIELVVPKNGRALELLFWTGKQSSIAPQIDLNGRRYFPLELDQSIQKAIRFPSSVKKFGNSRELLTRIGALFERYIEFPPADIVIVTSWVVSTWFPECWWRAPDLVISGWNMDLAVVFLRLLACVTCHPLMLVGVELATLRSLPMQVHPTLLINQPDISPRVLGLFRASNYRQFVVPARRGGVSTIAGSKAIFLGMNASEHTGFRISLPAAQSRSLFPTESDCDQVAAELQPQLLMYRLRYRQKVYEISALLPKAPSSQLVPLQACIQDDDEFASRVVAVADCREREVLAARSCRPEVALVEVLWAPAHGSRDFRVKEITKFINTLIRTRGETLEYSGVETGRMLENLGLPRHRNGSGMILRFSLEVRRRLHELATEFGLSAKKMQGCSLCQGR